MEEQKDSYDDEINMNTGSISILRKGLVCRNHIKNYG